MKKIFFLILFFIVGFSVKTFADINLKFKFEDAATVASIEANTSNSGWAGVYGININNGAVVSDWNTTQPFTKEIINGETWFSYTLVGSPNNPPSGFYMQGKINIGGNFHSQSSGNMLTSFTAETNGDWNLAYNISVEKTWATTTYPVEAVPSYGTLPLNYSSATNGLTLPIGVTSNGIAINNGLQLPTSGGYVQLYFEASNAPKMVEFQFRWGSTNAGHLALIETSVTGDNWVHLDSVGTGTACSHMYGKYATTTPALYSNIIQDHDVKYVRIRAISTANPLYIFGASVRNSYSLSSYDAEFTTNVIPANFANDGSELNVTGGKLKLYKKSQINSASDCPISLLAQNRYRLGGDITYPSVAGDYTAVFTLTTPISAGGACAKILIAGKSSDGTASPIVLNYDDGDTLVAYPKIATDTNTGNYIIVDLPIGLNSFSIGRWKGGSTFTVFGVKVFVTDDSQSVSTRLSDLKIGGTTIDGFSANVLEYDIATPNDAATSTPAVTATAEDATNTTVTLNPVSGIAEYVDGAASVTITVAENGKRDTRVYTVNFAKDVVAPTILSTPVEGAAVAKTGNITLNFSEAITINAACLDAIQLNGNTPTNPGVLAGNGLSWTLAYVDADWNATDALQLAVPAGYFTDGLNNFTSAFLLNLVFDETAPVLVSTTPVEGASNALRKSSAKIEFNETIDTLSFRNSGSINLIVAGQSVTATYTASDRVITIPYEGNWNDTVAISITGIKDIAGNETAVPVTLNFTIDEPLAKFNYAFNTNNKTVADAPGWIEYNTGKQLNPIYTQSSTCADQTLGAYRFESGDTVCLHLAKAGKVSIKVTANGNRIIGISDTYTGTLLKHWYNNTCNGNFTKEINTNEPVTVYIYGETGIANEFGGSSSTNVITTSGTIFEISVNHPIELATPVVADVLPVNNDYSGFQFGFDITAVPNATQYIIYYGTDSAAVANKTASTKTVDNPGQNPTIYVTIGSTEFIGQLSPKTTYYYAVEAIISGEGSDAAEGQILHSKLSLVKKNKTLGAPAIVSTIPATGNLLPLYDGSIVINFDEKIVVNPDVADTIRLGETPSFGDGISNPVECHASISADSLSITVTYPGSLAESANIRLQIPANKYMNLAETKLPLTNLAFTSPTLLSAPVVITATGFNGDATINLIDGENIPLSYLTYSVIEITFDKAITKVDDIPLTISDGTATTDVTGMVLLYGGNKIFGAQLSAYDWQRGKTYTIAIPDSAFVDANTTPNAAYNFTFSTEAAPIEYVQDVVYYTDFATNPGGYTPMIAHWADSVVANNLESQRYSPTFSAGETFSFDGYTFVPTGSNRRIDFYGYNSNSTVGPIVGLSYGRLALNNASQRLDLPTFTGPFTIRWSYNNGGANMRVMQLREGSNVLAADTVGGADAPNYPSAIFGQYVETRTDNINYNLFSAVNAAGFQDLEIFKTIATTNVTPLISHWFNPTKSVDLNSGADIDIRFTKRIKLLDPSLITITNSTVDSVKVVGNALRVWFSTTAYNSTVTVNIPVGTVAQETTNQPLTMPAQWDFTIGNYVATLPVEFENISIYPNPATDELKIECGKLNIRSVEIYDISGKCIYYSQLSTLNSQLSINISQFKSGVYFMRITGSNNEMKIAKIVKQ